MRRRVLATLAILWTAPVWAQSPDRVLVLDLSTRGIDPAQASVLADEIVQALREDGTRQVISTADVREMLTLEAQRTLMGCEEQNCIAEIAGTLGAAHVVTGSAMRLGASVRVRLTLLDTSRGVELATLAVEAAAFDELRELVRRSAFELVGAPVRPRRQQEIAWAVNEVSVQAGAALPAERALGPVVRLAYTHRQGSIAVGPSLTFTQSGTTVRWDDPFEPYREAVRLQGLRVGAALRWPATGGTLVRPYLAAEAGLNWLWAEGGEDAPAWNPAPVTRGEAFNVYAAPSVGLRLLPRASFGLSIEVGWLWSPADPGVHDRGMPYSLEAPPLVGTSRGRLEGLFVTGVFSHAF